MHEHALNVREESRRWSIDQFVIGSRVDSSQCSREWPCAHCIARRVPQSCQYTTTGIEPPKADVIPAQASVETDLTQDPELLNSINDFGYTNPAVQLGIAGSQISPQANASQISPDCHTELKEAVGLFADRRLSGMRSC